MKMYKRLILTYIVKYHRVDFGLLIAELRMTEVQIAELVSELKSEGFITVKDQRYELSTLGKEQAFSIWNEWSVYNDEKREKTGQKFEWDYLYIPANMI